MSAAFETAPAEILDAIWRNAWTPPDRRAPWEWCEEHVKSIPYSPIPGAFDSEKSPWIREPMEAVVDPAIPCVMIMAAIQSGKTTVVELASTYIIANLPGPLLWLDKTDADAKDQSESRLQKLYDECPPVKRLFHRNRNKKKLDVIHFAHGMTAHILGAHNKSNLQRRSVRWLIGDETWLWPTGHMAEAEARTTAFGWLGKRIFVSQGGFENDDTDKKWKSGDCREWTFECLNPDCQHRQQFKWKQVEWDKTAKDDTDGWDYAAVAASTVYLCEACNHAHPDTPDTRTEMNRTGKYMATNPKASGKVVSFHWNALCATSWGFLAELYLRAKESAKRGDIADLIIFYQKRLAVSWNETMDDFSADLTGAEYKPGEAWEHEGAISIRGGILSAPFDASEALAPLRFMTVDCQLDHFWALVRSWSGNGSSRLVGYAKLNTWEDVEAFQALHGVHGALCFIDARHTPYNVYRKCAQNGWTALMGDKRPMFKHITRDREGRVTGSVMRFYSKRDPISVAGGKCGRHFWSNLSVKDILARLIRNVNGRDGITWEFPNDVAEEYLRQLDSERRVKRGDVYLWEQIGKRHNHLWDCEAMQIVAALMLKIIGRESVKEAEAIPQGEVATD